MRAAERVAAAYRRIEAVDRPEVWTCLRPEAEALAEAEALEGRLASGEPLPLAGKTLAVKDNIDVAGMPSGAGCPAYAYEPGADAAAVARLRAAGAIVLGKANLDQFATGLVGTRSPYGAVRDMRRPEFVSGGSSSGSALAVALGVADLALGTDTAGSGRVPAAFQGIVGLKPTRGLVPVSGVVPACRSLDCVSVFARTLPEAREALAIIAGPDPADPLCRKAPADAPLAAPPAPRVGVPGPEELPGLSEEAREAFLAAARSLREAGAVVVAVDPAPFLQAGRLLYEGAFVAERHAAVGEFVEGHREEVDPTVGAIIAAAAEPSASALFADRERLDALALRAAHVFGGIDALLLPTTTRQPTIAAVAADPVGANSALGLYTNCANLLDLCAVAVPAGEADGGRFGVTLMAPAFADAVAADVAAMLGGAETEDGSGPAASSSPALPPSFDAIHLFVAGAHLSGQPLNHQLTERGARLIGAAETAPAYRLYALDTTPPKPGVVRVGAEEESGASLPGEVWALSPAALGSFLALIPQPMALGEVRLADGRSVVGFLCEPAALQGARDITALGGWRAYVGAE